MTAILVINSGSSSFKYQLIDMTTETRLASGLVERIGEKTGSATHRCEDGRAELHEREARIPDHSAGFRVMLEAFETHGPSLKDNPPAAIGHRVVQGGSDLSAPTLITPTIKGTIDGLAALAPLHNPANLEGIDAAEEAFPTLKQFAVFDTAFHQSMSPAAYTYALDSTIAREYMVRRYGFHGTSHKYVAEAAALFLNRPLGELRQIVLHLGNGASACAVKGGRSIDTSMGMTPLEGLVMGTRSGDIDPAVLFHLHRNAGLTVDQLDELLNRRSGMLGLAGSGDMRDVTAAAENGDANANLALDVYAHRLKHYIGAYTAQLGGLDTVVFTAGVGENSPVVRARALEGLEHLGIELDPARNSARASNPRGISTDSSRVAVLVVPTNEELEIARQTLCALRDGAKPSE